MNHYENRDTLHTKGRYTKNRCNFNDMESKVCYNENKDRGVPGGR
jgi:hypothetical protein